MIKDLDLRIHLQWSLAFSPKSCAWKQQKIQDMAANPGKDLINEQHDNKNMHQLQYLTSTVDDFE